MVSAGCAIKDGEEGVPSLRLAKGCLTGWGRLTECTLVDKLRAWWPTAVRVAVRKKKLTAEKCPPQPSIPEKFLKPPSNCDTTKLLVYPGSIP